MSLNIVRLPPSTLRQTVQPDELTIILCAPKAPGSLTKELNKTSIASLSRKNHYVCSSAGFLEGTHKPWIVVDLSELGANAFERRWALQDWGKNLRSIYSTKKLVVYFDDTSTSEQIIWAEDLVTSGMNATYEDSKWDSVRWFSAEPETLKALDPHYKERFHYQLEYRKWVNENPDSLTSLEIGARLEAFAKDHDCDFITLDESALRDQNMNLLLAVGQGAMKSPSRLHIVAANLNSSEAPIALIGKGITFDTGGINLKPHESFVNCMKNDMGGAALFSQLFMGLIKTGFKKPLILAIPCCENAIDANSFKPGAIIKSRQGRSVIIEHTDAEGRLILADALNYIEETYKPSHTFSAATLTTASLRQFGNYFTPVHFAPEWFKDILTQKSKATGELFTFWDQLLPFLQGNKTNAADLTNMGRLSSHASIGGGSNVAAHFLKEFASGPYTHLDIFNTIWNWSGDYPGAHYGCTGAAFNSLWHTFHSL
jgi:leucyl aminopeptidase